MTRYEKYEEIKKNLATQDVQVSEYTEINYGIQFTISNSEDSAKVRIYESKKKGLTVDLSQVKQVTLKALFYEAQNTSTANTQERIKPLTDYACDDIDNAMIGVDESGKGDYFGPLVVAGVHADKETKIKLMTLGVMDSKALTDKQITYLADKIKAICEYEVIVIGNQRYNALYAKINNLNKLLAWGHARVIENLLGKVECQYALSDQFGNEKLIQNALMEKGKQIKLEQRTKGEQNVVVAAASILARNEFVQQIKKLEETYQMNLPKGASKLTQKAAKDFVQAYGIQRLQEVAKIHFKTTQTL